jgi:drug/metabolite transporter (DMT)-like permease
MSGSINLPGIFLSLAAVAGWSFMSVMTRKVTQKYDPLTVTRAAIGIAAVCNLPVGISQLLLERNTVTVDISTILGMLYMGIFCTGGAYILWNRSLSVLEAGTCSAFYPIQPLVSTFLGIIFLKEMVEISFYLGAAFIIAGVLISLMPSRKMPCHICTQK